MKAGERIILGLVKQFNVTNTCFVYRRTRFSLLYHVIPQAPPRKEELWCTGHCWVCNSPKGWRILSAVRFSLNWFSFSENSFPWIDSCFVDEEEKITWRRNNPRWSTICIIVSIVMLRQMTCPTSTPYLLASGNET